MKPDDPRTDPRENEKPGRDVDHERHLDHSWDLAAQVRAARARAQKEIDAFGDVSEYEIRKIYGQRTDIKYDEQKAKEKLDRKAKSEEQSENLRVEEQQARKQDDKQTSLTFDSDARKEEEA